MSLVGVLHRWVLVSGRSLSCELAHVLVLTVVQCGCGTGPFRLWAGSVLDVVFVDL